MKSKRIYNGKIKRKNKVNNKKNNWNYLYYWYKIKNQNKIIIILYDFYNGVFMRIKFNQTPIPG